MECKIIGKPLHCSWFLDFNSLLGIGVIYSEPSTGLYLKRKPKIRSETVKVPALTRVAECGFNRESMKGLSGELRDTTDGRAHMLWVSLARYTEEYFTEATYLCCSLCRTL